MGYWGGARKNTGLVSESRGEPHSKLWGLGRLSSSPYTFVVIHRRKGLSW